MSTKNILFIFGIFSLVYMIGVGYIILTELNKSIKEETGCVYRFHYHRPAELICN